MDNISKEILKVLNKDKKARDLMAKFDKAVDERGQNVSDKSLDEARDLIYMMAIGQNKEAMDLLGEHMWEELRAN